MYARHIGTPELYAAVRLYGGFDWVCTLFLSLLNALKQVSLLKCLNIDRWLARLLIFSNELHA